MPGSNPGERRGGRKAGTPNRKTAELAEAIDASGMSPLDYLVALYRDEKAEQKDRAWAANAAAPYLHPRRAPVQQVIRLDLPDTSTAAGVAAAIARVVQEVSAGVIAPSEGQSLVAIMEAQRKAIETADIVERLEALEASNGLRRP